MKVLANDGVSKSGIAALESAGFEVLTTTVAQEQLINFINENQIDVLLVRSATTVRLVVVVLVWIILMLNMHVALENM